MVAGQVDHPDPARGHGGSSLTSSPRRTLRLAWPEPRYLVLAVALVVALNPLVNELRPIVEWLFPISSLIKATLAQMMAQAPGLGTSLLVFASVPAICEEFAFRGFILSGLEREHRTRSAILLSALMFGFLHVLLSLFQQLFNATLLGIVLGLLAVRSRSILPGIVFHFLNNALAVSLGYGRQRSVGAPDRPLDLSQPGGRALSWDWIVASVVLSGLLLVLSLEVEVRAVRSASRGWSRTCSSRVLIALDPRIQGSHQG